MLVNNLAGEEKYEITLGENICRFCLRTDKTEMKNIFLEETININDICAFASIKISKSDELPENVCLTCLSSIKGCLSFRAKIKESDKVLRNSGVFVAIQEVPTTNGTVQKVIDKKFDSTACSPQIIEKLQKNVNPLQKLILDLNISDEWEDNDNPFQASIKPRDEVRHKCSTCHKVFETKSKYDQHVITHENSIATCTICNEKLKNLKQLEAHLKYHSSTADLCCSVCKRSFLSKQILENHIKTHQDKSKENERSKEIERSKDETVTCTLCSKEFTNPLELKNHSATHVVITKKRFSCKMCEKIFPTFGLLQKHIADIHDDDRQVFSCDRCKMKFTNMIHLKAHKSTHPDNKRFVCHICNKKFPKNSQMQLHLKTHSRIRDIPCPMCNSKFSQKGNMKRHLALVHKNKSD